MPRPRVHALLLLLAACPPPAADDTGGPADTGTTIVPPAGTSTDTPPTTLTVDDATTGISELTDTPPATTTTTATTAPPDTTAPSDTTTTGAPDTTTTTTTTGDDTTTDTDDTTTGGPIVGMFDCCEPGCTYTLAQGHPYSFEGELVGDRLVTHDDARAVLWDRVSGQPIFVEPGPIYAADLAGDLLAIRKPDGLHWFSALDGALLGAAPSVGANGVASDGSYVWLGSPTELTVRTPDGVVLWTEPGNYSSVYAHGIAGKLHVRSPTPGIILAIDLDAGTSELIPHDGDLGGWFLDGSLRFHTHEGQAFRLYEPDGALIGQGLGSVYIAAYDHVHAGTGVREITNPGAIVHPIPAAKWQDHTAIWTEDDQLVVLGPSGIETSPLPIPQFVYSIFTFTHDQGHWVLFGHEGAMLDDLDRQLSPGQLPFVDAARSGRVVAGSAFDRTYVWDVAPDCAVTATAEFPRLTHFHAVADDGDVMVSAGDSANFDSWGTYFRSLPGGEVIGHLPGGDFEIGMRISDDGSLFSRLSLYTHDVHTFPDFQPWFDLGDNHAWIYVSPDGQHAIATDPPAKSLAEKTYVYGAGGLESVLDGNARGFLDDGRLVIGHYEDVVCQPFLCQELDHTDIVALDGTVIQATPLPDMTYFERISDTEILALASSTPDVPARVLDAYTGEELWSAPSTLHTSAVGADFVARSDGGDLVLHRWR
jgi:hypothetical protein